MQIKFGESRTVVLLPFLGIALKFPIIRLRRFLRFLVRDVRRGKFKERWAWPVEAPGSLKRLLFKGIVDNWKEYCFWNQERHQFTQPTYISFLGFLNIQKLGKICSMKEVDHWCQLHEITNGAVFADGHHFKNPLNFCFCDNKIRILDYGGKDVQKVVLQHGDQIMLRYDQSYDWETRKKATQVQPQSN